ncbi:MAG: peptidase inhibitor family I36 protein [Microbacteriaceae bacterium]
MKRSFSRAAAALLLVVTFSATGASAATASDVLSPNQVYPNGCGTLCVYTDPWWAGSQINYGGNDSSYSSSYDNKISSYFNNTNCFVDFYAKANYAGKKTTVAPGSMSYWLAAGDNDTWSSHKFRC